MFAAWGRIISRFPWFTFVGSIVIFVASVVALLQGGTLGTGRSAQTESGRAEVLMNSELPHAMPGGSGFTLVFGSRSLEVHDPRFRAALLAALAPLRTDPRVSAIHTPYDMPPARAVALESHDGHEALASLSIKDDSTTAAGYYPWLRSMVRSRVLDITAGGDVAVTHDVNATLNQDLQRAEQLSFPLALALLLIIFGTVVATMLPVSAGILTVVGGLSGVFLLTRVTDMSHYALNIVTLIGLGVAFDYSLLIVNRFRDELADGASADESLSRALATAGRAVFFSGVTVAVGLAGMLFYQGTFLASMGVAGALSVAFAVFYALTFLPALLALLGPRVNAGRLPWYRPHAKAGHGFWHGVAMAAVRRPLVMLVSTLALVVLAGLPVLGLRLAAAGVTTLPPGAESHRGYDLLVEQFPGQDQTQISVVVYYPTSQALTPNHVGALYDLSRRAARLPNVLRVEGPFDLAPALGRAGYQRLFAHAAALPARVRAAIHGSVGSHIMMLSVLTAQPATSDAARALVHAIRSMHAIAGGQILVGGSTASDIDTTDLILGRTPAAVGFIMVMTYLVLFLLLGSIIVPLKAVLTNVLSISAAFGAVVWIFQEGHLARQLNFTPGPLDPSVPVLLFCIVFGLSMDYEVFLLSRVQEAYMRTGQTRQAVAEGVERSGRLITGAAAVMVAVFLTFALAQTSLIKEIGLGMAIAVVVDATIVRTLLVPAAMCLLGDLNWWAPRSLTALHRRLNLGELEPVRPIEGTEAA